MSFPVFAPSIVIQHNFCSLISKLSGLDEQTMTAASSTIVAVAKVHVYSRGDLEALGARTRTRSLQISFARGDAQECLSKTLTHIASARMTQSPSTSSEHTHTRTLLRFRQNTRHPACTDDIPCLSLPGADVNNLPPKQQKPPCTSFASDIFHLLPPRSTLGFRSTTLRLFVTEWSTPARPRVPGSRHTGQTC